jgi:uncharacterized protein (DUF433 family)
MNTTMLLEQAKQAREAGFTAAAENLTKQAELARKLAIAYEHYRYVTREQIRAFVEALHARTVRRPTMDEALKQGGPLFRADLLPYASNVYDTLVFDRMEAYPGLPPADVLAAVKAAQERKIFDAFEVAHVQPVATRIVYPDPIVFGLVEGCGDRFFIAEWGEDVKLADLIGSHEG